jgi:hypothetical protein
MAKKAEAKAENIEVVDIPVEPPRVLPLQGTDRLVIENSALKVQLLRERASSLQRDLSEAIQLQLTAQEDVLLRHVADGDHARAKDLSQRYVYDAGSGALIMQSPRPAK